MTITIEKPIEARRLPREIRGTISPRALVRVSYEILEEQEYMVPKKRARLLRLAREAERGIGISPVFHSVTEALAHLHLEVAKAEKRKAKA